MDGQVGWKRYIRHCLVQNKSPGQAWWFAPFFDAKLPWPIRSSQCWKSFIGNGRCSSDKLEKSESSFVVQTSNGCPKPDYHRVVVVISRPRKDWIGNSSCDFCKQYFSKLNTQQARLAPDWYGRPNLEDRINRKLKYRKKWPKDQINRKPKDQILR